MPNPFEVETLTVQYQTRVELLLQQEISRLRGMVDMGSHVGKMASPIQQISPLEFTQPQARYGAIEFQLSQWTRRWVSPQDRHLPVPIDTFDQLKTIVDPKSGISDAVKAAAERFYDDVIIAAAFATAQTGVDASSLTSETWPATTFLVADTFDSSASSGMTYSKIVEGRRILEHYQNDLRRQRVTLVVGSQQNSDMMNQMQVIDKNFNDKTTVEDGYVNSILGTSVIDSERLNTSSSNSLRNCIMFVRSGLYLGLWKDLAIDVTQRKDLVGHPWQIYGMLSAGATRTQLGKIVQINCADTSSVDPTAP